MRSDDPEAANLFSCLFKYIPREGEERKREPLEDFCTETLAYLIYSSLALRQQFAKDVLCLDPDVVSRALIRTQCYAGECEENQHRTDSRFDFLLEPTCPDDPYIGIESKIKATPGLKQFQRYRLAIEKEGGDNRPAPKLFLLVPQRYRKEWQIEAEGEGFVVRYWEEVHALLVGFAASDQAAAPLAAGLASQFARFLASNGLRKLKMHMKPNQVDNVKYAAKLMNEWSFFLPKLRAELAIGNRGEHTQWDPPNDDDRRSYYGTYGSHWNPYAGFELNNDTGEVNCYYQRKVPGPFPERLVPPPEKRGDDCFEAWFEKGDIQLVFRAPYPDAQDDSVTQLLDVFRKMKEQADQEEKKLEERLRLSNTGR